MKEPEALYRKRYWGVLLLFEEDIKRMLDLFTVNFDIKLSIFG